MKKTTPHSPMVPPLLHHVTVNTGHVALHELNLMHSVGASEFLSLLEQRSGEIPVMPGFAFALTEADHCCQFILAHQGVEIITCGLAWGAGTGESLWRWLGDYYDYAVPRIPQWRTACPSTPPPLPWLGAVLTANLKLIPHGQARLLGAVERDLALAVIHRSLTRN
jgi:hypothetical protein